MKKIDLLVDFSGSVQGEVEIDDVVQHIVDPDGLGALTGRATCILPARANSPKPILPLEWQFAPASEALAASNCALAAAARARRPLAVMIEPVFAGSEPVSALIQALEADPMFGFAIARIASESGELAKLAVDLGDPEIDRIPRSVLASLAAYYIVPEVVGGCFVLRSEVVANFGPLDSRFRTTRGAWLHYLCRARRVGFRGLIVNRAVVYGNGSCAATVLSPPPDDFWLLHRQYPDTDYARDEFRRLPAHEFEILMARAYGTDDRARKTLLVDGRGMPAFYNGTTTCVLGLLDGLAAAASEWTISVLVKPEAKQFHNLSQRYPGWQILDHLPEQRFSAAFRLSQPWDFDDLFDLHSLALFNFYLMLDTISWDVIYNGSVPEVLEETWRFVARHADGILYISDDGRQRFVQRFPPAAHVRHYVCYLPFHRDEYVKSELDGAANRYILVLGNQLDHKWVLNSVDVLATAFPFEHIRVLGCAESSWPNVVAFASGKLADEEVEILYANARVIIVPSFYEGFGLHTVKGLNYGRPVVARRSALVSELAAHCRADGRLYGFSDHLELVEIVARVLKGDWAAGSLPTGAALHENEEPLRWRDIGRNILAVIEESLQGREVHWPERMRVFRMLKASAL
jgi:glycosyltransferase involved in cell wall biosynthesis